MDEGRTIILTCRVIREGRSKARALKSGQAISFFGGVDPESGAVVEKGHEIEGKAVSGLHLVFPAGKGSTVGSYVLYRMAKVGTAPAGLVLRECDSVIAVGAVIAGIPCVDRVDIDAIDDGDEVEILDGAVRVRKVRPEKP